MNQSRRHITDHRALFSGLLCAVVVLLAPGLAHAVPSGWLIPAGDGQCYDGTPDESPKIHHLGLGGSIDEPNASPSDPLNGRDGPCSIDPGSESDADASSAVCFEAAGAQISTIPELLADARGREMAEDVVRDIRMKVAQLDQRTKTGKVAFSASPDPMPADDADDGKISCTTHPAECHSLPPAPSPVQIDSTLPHIDLLLVGLSIDDAPEPPQMRPLNDTELGPRAGHRDLLDPPPKRS